MRSVEAPAAQLLYSLLMQNGWWDVSVLLCQETDVSRFLLLVKNNTRFHLGAFVNLTNTPDSSSPSSSSSSSSSPSGAGVRRATGGWPRAERPSSPSTSSGSFPFFFSGASSSSTSSPSKWDQQQALMRRLEALRDRSSSSSTSTVAVVTIGCEIREVRRLWTLATRMMLPDFHWVLGDSQNVAELRTEGLPLGLLAHGVMGTPTLDHYVQDALELVARAVGSAARENPTLALIPGTTNCMDLEQQGNGSSGAYLAR